MEKPDLLPPRLEDGGAPEDGGRAGRGVAPLMCGLAIGGCLDLLLGPRRDLRHAAAVLAQTAANGQQTVADYKVKKCSHQNTLASCGTEGLQFLPIVAEACGGG